MPMRSPGVPRRRSAPGWACRSPRTPSCCWPGLGPTTAGWPTCATTVPSGGPEWRWCRSSTTWTPRWPRLPEPGNRGCGEASSSLPCGTRALAITSVATTRSGPLAKTWRCRSTPTRGPLLAAITAPAPDSLACTWPKCGGGPPVRCGSCCIPACSSGTRVCAMRLPSVAAFGPPTCCGPWTPPIPGSTGVRKSWPPTPTAI